MLNRMERHQAKVNGAIQDSLNTIEHQVAKTRIILPRRVLDKIKHGKPCDKSKRITVAKIRQFAMTVTSKKVPLLVFESRNEKCNSCSHKSEYKDKWWCECCGCPQWHMSDCKTKNSFARHFCPLGEFGAYDG